MTKKWMKGVWKYRVGKRFVDTSDRLNNEHDLEMIREKIVKLTKDLSSECEVKDIEELLEQESEEITDEELNEMEKERVEEERRIAEKRRGGSIK